MFPINKLSPETCSKIAAGEIIERPVNVIKELVENSLDASSSRIRVEVEGGGKTLIRVEDDGLGIPGAQLPLAVQNYSTSKIREIDDIHSVKTLGFRGEALASIKAVSHLTIKSRSAQEDIGREMRWKGSDLTQDGPVAKNPGTEVLARNLFYNLPARKKFLSSDAAELRRITAILQSFALSFPEVGFTLTGNAKEILSYPASSLEERVEVVFGSGVFTNLRFFERLLGAVKIYGYTSLPGLTRGNRSLQFIFVNRRPVKDKLLGHALRQAYQSLIPGDRFPLGTVFLEVPPGALDVNVHPTKAEVRFESEREIHRLVSSTIREVLKGQGNTISFKNKVESVYRAIFPSGAGLKDTDRKEGFYPGDSAPQNGIPGSSTLSESRPGWLFQELPQSLFEFQGGEESAFTPVRLYWQLHQSYIFIQIRGGMVVIDQHAAHERILYDQAGKNLKGGKAIIQPLLFPATLELSVEEYEEYERISAHLPSLGFEVEPFGMRSVIVRGIPAGVKRWDDGLLLQNILAEKGIGHGGMEDLLKTYACHAAIKAGDKLSLEEMESLTDQLFATEFPFTCPHGRPTMLRVELADIERRFMRTVTPESK
ncbi:MAG: DNA mismatch repair endonuclease MutL [Candidatus Krumholzibacteriota bacterium]|nr:DNA mismatch repair endonuclease MutL [Candidatus Krumholzibacteriota bacterium]